MALLCLSGTSVYNAQSQNWFFGGNAGLDFSTTPPSIISGGALSTYEGCSSASDILGNLLFYTNGVDIYNRNHQLMANGSGLNGNTSTTQSALVIKQPGNASIYYVFTLDKEGGTAGCRYSLVDMSLAAGMGSVTVKNTFVYGPSTEKLCATRHCNGTDIWIVSHELNSSVFRSYLLSSTGLSSTPVTSAVGSIVSASGSNFYSTYGQMKISPNGKKLGLVHFDYSRMELFDFNASTGSVSNALTLSSSLSSPYGCEFSPDGTKVYSSEFVGGKVSQWDICAGSNTAIVNSKQTFSASSPIVIYGSMQLAPDGKIYVARSGMTDLAVINDPNMTGSSCNFVDVGLSIAPKTCSLGLPNFLSNNGKLLPAPFSFTVDPMISCNTATFQSSSAPPVNNGCAASSYSYSASYWLFGDPLSGASNTSAATNPTHAYSTPGTYYPKLVYTSACGADTVMQILTLPSAMFNVSGKTSICKGEKTILTASGANTYTWSTAATTSTVSLNPGSTTVYTVTAGSTSNPCPGTKTVSVIVSPCLGVNAFALGSQLQVYPNPFMNALSMETLEPVKLSLFNHLGTLILETSLSEGTHTLDLKDLADGIYILKTHNEEGSKTLRLVKSQH